MKLSLWILKDHLEQYHPEITWTEPGNPVANEPMDTFLAIERVRLYNDTAVFDSETLYVGTSDDYFCSGQNQVVCRFINYYLSLDSENIRLILNEILGIFYYYQELEKKWAAFSMEEADIQKLIDSGTEELQNPIMVFDSSDSLVAFSSSYQNSEIDNTWSGLMKEKATAASMSLDFHNPSNFYLKPNLREPYFLQAGLFPRNTYNQNLYYRNSWCGICGIIEYQKPLSIGQVHVFRIFCSFLQACIDRMVKEQRFRLEDSFLAEVASGKTESLPALVRQLRMDNWAEGDEFLLLKAAPESGGGRTSGPLCRIIASFSPYLMAAEAENDVLALADRTKLPEEVLFSFLKGHLERASCRCGVSDPFTEMSDICKAAEQADIALSYGKGTVARIGDCRVPYLMDALKDVRDRIPSHPVLQTLRDYDREHHTEYFRTLFVFLRSERNHTITAAELHIHRNTLMRRLEKMEELFPLNLEDSGERFLLLLSFYMDESGEKSS